MRHRLCGWMLAAWGCVWGVTVAAETTASVQQVLAGAPTDLSVTVYRAPGRESGAITLDELGGFALIRETRVVTLPAGTSRVRFEGVADGIQSASAIVSGLPNGILEKNLDADLLSPATLIAAAAGRPVALLRTNVKSGRTERLPGVILTGPNADGVVFQTQDGIEALRCSGLPETLAFSDTRNLSASPTLSVLVHASVPMTRRIQLAYLASGFDWAANYSATLAANGKTLDLGAWVTLANGNGIGFPNAHTQVVAGRLNRQSDDTGEVEEGGQVLAMCWPRQSTSDTVPSPMAFRRAVAADVAGSPSYLEEVIVTGSRVRPEQLGDLKLYRVPQRTTFNSRESKQVRLLDRAAIPIHQIFTSLRFESEGAAESATQWEPASILLRTRNVPATHLGLPLPSGQVVVFATRGAARLMLHEAPLRDIAVNEDVEIDLGSSSDVQIRSVTESQTVDPAQTKTIPLVPGVVSVRQARVNSARRVEISNAHDSSVDFELLLQLQDGLRLIRADHPIGAKNGLSVFRLKIPAHRTVSVRYQTDYLQRQAVRD